MKILFFFLAFTGLLNAQQIDPAFFEQTWYLYEIFDSDTGETFIVEGYQPYNGNPSIAQIQPRIFIGENLEFSGFGICNTISGTLEQDALTGDLRAVSSTSSSNSCGFFEDMDEPYIFGPFAIIPTDPNLYTIVQPTVTDNGDGTKSMKFGTQPFVEYRYRNTPILNNDTFTKERVNVYPNPAQEKIYIAENNTVVTALQLSTVTGTIITHKELTSLSAENEVDISSLDHGLYLLTLFSGKQTQTFKIVKN